MAINVGQRHEGGAVEFLTKPLREQDLSGRHPRRARTRRCTTRIGPFSRGVTCALRPADTSRAGSALAGHRGLMNKQVAGELEISEIMVKVHRGNVMRKMVAKSLADL